jgi:prenyltransferase beta subunit
MLQVMGLSKRVLNDSTELIQKFVLSKLNPDGGFQDRVGESDLYYTVFGLECLKSLQCELPIDRLKPWLESFKDGDELDLVHLTSLIRCWSNLEKDFYKTDKKKHFLKQLQRYRSADGGYNTESNAEKGTGYAAFLVYGAFQELHEPIQNKELLIESIQSLHVGNGSYGMLAGQTEGTTPTTAAACLALYDMGIRDFDLSRQWLLNNFSLKSGGFFAIPNAPMPDLLSTATALHTLTVIGADFDDLKEACLDFVDSLWTNSGSFYGTWPDDILDVEYTLYGLLALGHLAV